MYQSSRPRGEVTGCDCVLQMCSKFHSDKELPIDSVRYVRLRRCGVRYPVRLHRDPDSSQIPGEIDRDPDSELYRSVQLSV